MDYDLLLLTGLEMYGSLYDTQENGFGRIRIVLPDGESIIGPQFDVDLTQFLRLRQIANMPLLPIRGEGIYRFILEYLEAADRWVQKFEVPLRMLFTSSES